MQCQLDFRNSSWDILFSIVQEAPGCGKLKLNTALTLYEERDLNGLILL